MRHRMVGTIILLSVLVLLGGCGGDDGEGGERGTLILPNGGTILSSDGGSRVEVPDAAIDQSQRFTVEKVINPPPDPGLVEDTAYRYGPEGWVFDAPVTITIGYEEANIPSGIDESMLKIARLQGTDWEPVGSSAVDQGSNSVSAQITSFSVFAVVGEAATPAEEYVFDSAWGSQGADDGDFGAPGGIDYHGGLVFVSDTVPFDTERIQRFDADGVFLSACRDFLDINGFARGIEADDAGNVYTLISRTGNPDIIVKVASDCGVAYTRDADDLGLAAFEPTDVALDGAGNVFIAEMDQARLTQLNAAGEFVRHIGAPGTGDGEFSSVGGVAVGPDGSIYATDRLGYRVLKFSNSGAFLDEWGQNGDGDGEFSDPYGVDVDQDGNVYVIESVGRRVQKFSEDGTFMTAFGEAGDGDGQFNLPTDLAVTPDGSTVYVLDTMNYRVQKFVRQ